MKGDNDTIWAYIDGIRAFFDKKEISENPYPITHILHNAWRYGWKCANDGLDEWTEKAATLEY